MNHELRKKQDELEEIRLEMKKLNPLLRDARYRASIADANYSQAKSEELLMMEIEEHSPEYIASKHKRNDNMRESRYRTKFADLRLTRNLANDEVEDLKSYQKQLESMQSNLQTQCNLEKEVDKLG